MSLLQERHSKYITSVGDYDLIVPECRDGDVVLSFFTPASEKLSDLSETIQIALGDVGFESRSETLQKSPSFYHTLLSPVFSDFLGEGNDHLARGSSAY